MNLETCSDSPSPHLLRHLLHHVGRRREVEIGRALWRLTDAPALSLAEGGRAESRCRGHVDGVGSQDLADELSQVLALPLGNEQVGSLVLNRKQEQRYGLIDTTHATVCLLYKVSVVGFFYILFMMKK